MKKNLLIVACLFTTVLSFAQLATPQILSSNMVLQRGQVVPVWGTASPNERVTVVFAKQKTTVKADAQGKWTARLQPLEANKNPQQLLIKGKKTNLVYDNVLVGEVWLCSGQSNMEYRMSLNPAFALPAKGKDLAAEELKKPANNLIRVYNTKRDTSANSWKVADGESLVSTAAAGYFFGKSLLQKLDVPVGIITSAVGGTRIEAWTTKEAYDGSPRFAGQLKANDGKIDGFRPGNWYSSMIAPLVPFAIKGFLWYQGESNCGISDRQYAEKFEVLAKSWRKAFEVENAPVYYVLLAPHIYSDRMHRGSTYPVTAEGLPLFWAQQVKAATLVPYSEYVVVSDLVDNLKDIHPSYKWEVGGRLARVALAKTYGLTDTIWSGPRVRETVLSADSIVIRFDHVGEGLKTNDGKRLVWFELAAKDGLFRPALAELRGKDNLIVYHPEMKNPVSVRFGWHETAIPNLVNAAGLPATPFILINP